MFSTNELAVFVSSKHWLRKDDIVHHVDDAIAGFDVRICDQWPRAKKISVANLEFAGIVTNCSRKVTFEEVTAADEGLEFQTAHEVVIEVYCTGNMVKKDPRELTGGVRCEFIEFGCAESLEGIVCRRKYRVRPV